MPTLDWEQVVVEGSQKEMGKGIVTELREEGFCGWLLVLFLPSLEMHFLQLVQIGWSKSGLLKQTTRNSPSVVSWLDMRNLLSAGRFAKETGLESLDISLAYTKIEGN